MTFHVKEIVFGVCVLGPIIAFAMGMQLGEGNRQHLQRENEYLREQLEKERERPLSPIVRVVCECPDYEDGWDDAESMMVQAEECVCREGELSDDDIKSMCADLEEYGYVPAC